MQEKSKLWAARIEEWQRSGLSQQQYCTENHLAVSTFGWWRKRLKAEAPHTSPFVEIPRERALSHTEVTMKRIQVSVGRYTIHIGEVVDPRQLEVILDVLDNR